MLRITLTLAALLTLPLTTAAQPDDRPPVIVAGKDFPESELLCEIMAQMIERETDIPVVRKRRLSTSAVIFGALKAGEIDVYPEYTGTAWEEYFQFDRKVNNPIEAYLVVSEKMEEEMGIRWLKPFGFSNSYALAMTEERAKATGISRISDLKEHEKSLRVRISHAFSKRNDGFEAMCVAYGLDTPDVVKMRHALIYDALTNDTGDVADVWTTDGKLYRLDLRLLEDDKGFFPPYDCAPIIRMEMLERYPELEGVLNKLAYHIDNRKMQRMNATVDAMRNEGDVYERVAADFLDGKFDETEEELPEYVDERQKGFFEFMLSQAPTLGRLTLEHLLLTGVAVGLAVLVAVPLGILLTRWSAISGVTLGTAGVIQTVPSLALLAVMIPLFGIGWKPAVAALFLYALLPIIRNTYTGIKEVDNDLLEAARGIGLTDWQILRKVELPLAVRTIMAGVRTSAVIGVGVATLAAFIGGGGLGGPIIDGLNLNNTNWILAGAIPAAALALLVDYGLGWVEHAVRPRGVGE